MKTLRFVWLGLCALSLAGAVPRAPSVSGPQSSIPDADWKTLLPRARDLLATNGFRVNVKPGDPTDYQALAKKIRRRAEAGNPAAQVLLGACFAEGIGVPKDYKEAARFYRLAAMQGSATAQFWLGAYLDFGIGGQTNPVEALHWYRPAAKAGYGPAQFFLAISLTTGMGGETNWTEAFDWLQKAGRQLVPGAVYQTGIAYWFGRGTATNTTEALRWLTQAADLRFVPAYFALAILRSSPENGVLDLSEAADWGKRSANAGDRQGKAFWGNALLLGKGVDRDTVSGIRWLTEAANEGDAYAEYILGSAYLEGGALEKNLAKAAHWLELSSEAGNRDAQNDLAVLLEHGRGVAQDPWRAFHLYRASADRGNRRAQANLARCYQIGVGTDIDFHEMMHWLRVSAESGYNPAQYDLGRFLVEGSYGVTDIKEGIRWLTTSAATNAKAMFYLGQLEEKGERTPRDLNAALEWYRKAENAGNQRGACAIAECLFKGIGAPVDPAVGVGVLEEAASAGNRRAARMLGEIYLHGQPGLPRDLPLAKQWLDRAHELNEWTATYLLSIMYVSGRGVEQDAKRAFALGLEAAIHGCIQAQASVGIWYGSGTGVETNNDEAVKWLTMAAAKKSPRAEYSLAVAKLNGTLGLAPDPNAAHALIQAAAESGLPEAQRLLGYLFVTGGAGVTNHTEGLNWLERAAKQGDGIAQAKLAATMLADTGMDRNTPLAYFWALIAEKNEANGAHALVEKAARELSNGTIREIKEQAEQYQPQPIQILEPPMADAEAD